MCVCNEGAWGSKHCCILFHVPGTSKPLLQVVSLVESLPESQRTKQLKLGINEVGLGSPPGGQGYDARVFVARNMQLAHSPSTQQPVLVAATHEVSNVLNV